MNKLGRIAGVLASSCFAMSAAFADENGTAQYSGSGPCPATPSMAMDFICKALGAVGGSCNMTANNCVNASQELFSGLDIESASPTNIKPWTGFGGAGAFDSAATVCLAKDLQTAPMSSHAETSIAIGTFSIDQQVLFTNWDHAKHAVSGVQTARVCGPVMGCLDAYQQPFTLTPITTSASGQLVGGYKVLQAQSIGLDTIGMQQGLAVAIPSFQVVTPYGAISATPTFGYTRGVGWILAPYNGNNTQSSIPMNTASGSFKMNAQDLYGRWPGLTRSQAVPYKETSGGAWVPTNQAWISQAGLGGRSGLVTANAWTPPAGVDFPVRPDLPAGDSLTPRTDAERTPGAGFGAAVKIAYSPVDLIPDWIRNSAFIGLNFDVYVTPNVEVGAASQVDFWTAEAAHWKGEPYIPTFVPPAPTVTPPDLVSQHAFQMYAGSSAAARFALDAGVDLTITLNIPLVFKTIHKTIIDIHPTTTVAQSVSESRHMAPSSASFLVDSGAALSTGKLFTKYHTLAGSNPDGMSHIKMCLAQPTASQPPPVPTYQPGNPQDLVQNLQMPCNICVGMADQDFTTGLLLGPNKTPTTQHIKGFLQLIKPISEANMPASSRWSCDSLAKVGCYDMCSVSKDGLSMTVAETAKDMLASGALKAHGGRLMCQ